MSESEKEIDKEKIEQIDKIIKRKKILNKNENYLLYELGLLGNKPKTWNSFSEIQKSGWTGNVSIRARNTMNWRTRYGITREKLKSEIEDIKIKGLSEKEIVFNESMPDQHLSIQGEMTYLKDGTLFLMYTTLQEPMKRALKKERKEIWGFEAERLLKKHLWTSSWEDIQEIFSLFPNSCIEFSTYHVAVGNLNYRNTIIWEVRDY